MKEQITLEKIGLAFEAFGVTVTASAISMSSPFWSYAGMVITGLGRALEKLGKPKA